MPTSRGLAVHGETQCVTAIAFGSPDTGGANPLMADGSVKFFSESIDPAVLNALATPAGGEPLPEY